MDDKMMLSCQQTIDAEKDKINWNRTSIIVEPHGVVLFLPYLEEHRPPRPQIKRDEGYSLEVVDDDFYCSPVVGAIEHYLADREWNVGG